jgi:3'(2'), 5'-bisphosphate nucleotidase
LINNYLELALEASIEAGKKILEVYDTSFSVELKDDRSPLTQADRESHRIISDYLSATGLPVLSEEGKSIPYDERRNWSRFWLVDPLDGTKEFVKRNGEFTVNIALIENQQPVMGIIYSPVLRLLYFASRELGSFKKEGVSPTYPGHEALISGSRKLSADTRPETFTVVASRSHFSPETETFVNALKEDHPDLAFVSSGSSLKLCLVAEGRANVYPRLAPTMEWDTGAGQAIVECAGGKVVEFDTREPLKYNKQDLLNPWFIVT